MHAIVRSEQQSQRLKIDAENILVLFTVFYTDHDRNDKLDPTRLRGKRCERVTPVSFFFSLSFILSLTPRFAA